MRVGVVILPAARWADSAAAWRLVDDLGFAHAWTFDHVVWRELADRPWFAAVPTLAAAAVVTRRIRLGTLVCTPNFRHPVPLAKEAMTLDDMSGGRFVLGVGAGAAGVDDTVIADRPWPAAERADRFAEFVALTDHLLRHQVTHFTGRHYRADAIPMWPGCVRRPRLPLAVAATGPRGIRLAARYADVWVTNGTPRGPGTAAPVTTAERVRTQVAELARACDAIGRDPAGLAKLVVLADRDTSPLASVDAFVDTLDRYAAAGVTDVVVPLPRREPPFAGDLAVLERVATEVLPGLPSAGLPSW